MKQRLFLILVAAACFAAGVAPSGQSASNDPLRPSVFEGIRLSSVGPSLVTGRIADFDVDPKNPNIYVGAPQSFSVVPLPGK